MTTDNLNQRVQARFAVLESDLPERWLPVPGWEPDYQVSSLGRVWSRPRKNTRGGILRARIDGCGYREINLSSRARKDQR